MCCECVFCLPVAAAKVGEWVEREKEKEKGRERERERERDASVSC